MTESAPLRVEGSAKQRGVALGRAHRDAIVAHLDGLFESWRRSGVSNPQAYARDFLAAIDFDPAIDRWAPDLREEIEGLASGAAIPLDRAWLLQLLDEEWAYRKSLGFSVRRDKCSAVALRDDAYGACIGQNMDLGAYTNGFQQLVLHGAPEQPDQLIFTLAGVIGLLGVNAAGVAVCVNSMPQGGARRQGLPVAFVIRRLLQERSADAAADLLFQIDHATSQHYLIADRQIIRSLEARPDRVDAITAFAPGRFFHTNHPLGEAVMLDQQDWKRRNSEARLSALQARLGQGRPDIATLAAALASRDDPEHPVCQPLRHSSGNTDFTTGSMISALRVDGSVSGVWSSGPPAPGGWRPWSLVVGR